MGAIAERRTGLKTAWRDLSARAERGEAFGWIQAVSLMYKLGHFQDREQALEVLFKKATAADLRAYRQAHGIEALT
jgi:hypothetical protein